MKLRVKRVFKYTFDNSKTTQKLMPGTYSVPKEIPENAALLAIQFGAAVWVNTRAPKKVAPENKAVKVPANKQKTIRKK